MGKKTAAQRARRNAAKRKRKVTETLSPTASDPNKKQMEEEKKRRSGLPRPQKPTRHDSRDPILFGPASSSSSDSDAAASDDEETLDVEAVLEAYSKDQLITLLCDAAVADPTLVASIRAAADGDVSHRKVFVHGLPWDVTDDTLRQALASYGPVDACNVVVDKATGRCKGYGFVLFRTRSGAIAALKQSHKQIGGRVVHCQLASVGPTGASGALAGHHADTAGRKVYVSNVHAEAKPEKLRAFFAKFGEIESGPSGFDLVTGKSRGYAMFVYKTQEGARNALREPHKMFEGHQLHCQWASEPAKVKDLASAGAGLVGAAPQPVLAAVAAAQNLSLYSHNPAYAALLGQNPLLAAAGAVNAAALTAPVLGPSLDGGLATYGGGSSLLGAYGAQGAAGLQGLPYGHSQLGRLGGSYDGMSSFL